MRRQTPLAHLLYNHLFPHPASSDPPSFSAHLARNLVPEVRIEVATFYGDLNSAEARYPGLNYCHPPHRMRLGRFPHHKRLFKAFDELGLTYNEIQDFCCWEGTKWARERYEKDEGVVVRDTTGDEIGPYVDRKARAANEQQRQSIPRKTGIPILVDETSANPNRSRHPQAQNDDAEMIGTRSTHADENGEHDQAEQETAQEAAAREEHMEELARYRDRAITQSIIAAWQSGHRFPPEIEQFLKDQSERGTLGATTRLPRIFDRRSLSGYLPLLSSNASTTTTTTSAGAVAPHAAA